MNSNTTPIRLIGTDVIIGIAAAVEKYLNPKKLILVCDDNTWAAAGEHAYALLKGGAEVKVHSLGQQSKPTLTFAKHLANQATHADALLAVGSGSINDLTKYAAAMARKPYAVIATAASMNGYTSANASLEDNGYKQSFSAQPPVFVLGDIKILSAAPKRLMRAGLGDTLCRTTVEADMLLSHHLLGTPYPYELFDVLRRHEPVLLAGSMNNRDNETVFLASLFSALLDAGDAMTHYGSSAPASQGEHMIAHTLELKYGSKLRDVMHGELIAITSLTMSQIQQRTLLSVPTVRHMAYTIESFERLFGKRHSAELSNSYTQKIVTAEQASELNAHIGKHWEEIKSTLSEIMLPTNTLERAFMHSAIQTKPSHIGLEGEHYRLATSYAHLTRNRFTFLDLAAMNINRTV